jgi:hypothetical protein
MTKRERELTYVLTVLSCVDNMVNGKQSYPTVSEARYAIGEAQAKVRAMLAEVTP